MHEGQRQDDMNKDTSAKHRVLRKSNNNQVAFGFALVMCLCVVSCGYSRFGYNSPEVNRKQTWAWELNSYFLPAGSVLPEKDEYGNYLKEIRGDTLFFYIVEVCQKDTAADAALTFDIAEAVLSRCADDEAELLELDSTGVFDGGKGRRCIERFYGPFSVSLPRPDTIVVRQRITVSNQVTGAKVAEFPYESVGILKETRRSHFTDFMNGN